MRGRAVKQSSNRKPSKKARKKTPLSILFDMRGRGGQVTIR